MPYLTLSRKTVVAPTPGLVGQDGPLKKAVFGLPGDVLKIEGITLTGSVPWLESHLYRGEEKVGSGYVVVAALFGQPGADEVIAGAYSNG